MENVEPELEVEKEEEENEDVLVEYDIASYPSDFTLSGLQKMWQDDGIAIPDFQRSFVWTIYQSSKLIESFLIGLPVPPIFLYIDNANRNLVVDGQQRLLSVVFYLEGFFGPENEKGKRQVFRLLGLNSKSPYYNKQFNELQPSQQRKLENSVLRAINIRQLSPREDNTGVYYIFERLNTGGTPLTAQEIRNVVFRGDLLNKLKELNNDSNWRRILGKAIPDKHQKDVELILRAFGLSVYLSEYEKPMKEFLNNTVHRNKNINTRIMNQFVKNFSLTTKLIAEKLPSKPFSVRGPLNTSIFDSIFCNILNNIDVLPSNIKDRYDDLIKDSHFIELTRIGTTDTKTLKDRFAYVNEKLVQ